MTRSELLATLARRLNKNTTLDTATQARLLEFLNEAHREILSKPGLRRLRDDTLTFASVNGQARYNLPSISKINRIFETTNDRLLQPLTLDQYRAIEPDPAGVTGTPSCWVWMGYDVVAKQPADQSTLYAKSNNAGDTQTIYIEGLNSAGYSRTASATLTGTTAVAIGTITDWVRVTKCYLSSAAVGAVQLWEDDASTGTELARISPGATMQRYVIVSLYPTPGAAITYTADVTIAATGLAQDTDEPRLPPDFHDVLVYAAVMKEYEKTDDQRLPVAMARYKERLGELLYWMAESASGSTALTSTVSTSRLGAWFPSGT